jgi:parallel beta-helix repeat protein
LDDISEYVKFYYSHSSVSPKGVDLRNTTNVSIINCTIQYVADGVELGYAKDCRITDNTFWYCAAGIYTPFYTEGLLIQNNTVFGGVHGAIIYSVSSVMDSNTIVSTWGAGFEIHGENNTLLRNRIGWCDPNAYDGGGFLDNHTLENRWHDDLSTGNSWSDWESGVYEIRGDAGAIDRFPSAFIGDFSGPSTTYNPWSSVGRYDVWLPVDEVGFSIDFNDPSGVDTVLLWYRLPTQDWDFVVMSNVAGLYQCTVRIPECPIAFSYFYSSNDTQGYESFTGLIELVVDFFSPPSYLILNVGAVAIITVAILATNRENLSMLRPKVDDVRLETDAKFQSLNTP